MPRKKKAEAAAPTVTVAEHINGTVNGTTDAFRKLTRSEVQESASFGREQALALVGLYYDIQKLRVGAGNKISAHERDVDILSDSSLIRAMHANLHQLEKDAGRGLKNYAREQKLGRWAMSCLGVGPVITAALLAHIDLNIAQTAGAIWKFAGLLPKEDQRWEKGKKRPYNAALKTICWKLGESFKKVAANTPTPEELAAMTPEKRKRTLARLESLASPAGLYARLYRERKIKEEAANERGEFSHRASMNLQEASEKRYRITEPQRDAWADGKLQPVGLDRRAARYAVKIFLSHYHTVGREILGLPLVRPWVLEHGGHVHYIPVPNWPMTDDSEAEDVDAE